MSSSVNPRVPRISGEQSSERLGELGVEKMYGVGDVVE